MKIKPLLSGATSVLLSVVLISIFNKPAIPIGIGMLIGLFIFAIGYIFGC